MRRWSILFGTLMVFGPLTLGQQQSASSDRLFSSDLVQWSYMQQPQQPEPGPARQAPTPDPQPETPSQQNPTVPAPKNPAAPEGSQTAAAQTFTGTISKEAESFILQVSQSVFYKLDNQQQVQQYEGQRVRVTGRLDASINLIHVETVEPLR
jgi:hypothetical protein